MMQLLIFGIAVYLIVLGVFAALLAFLSLWAGWCRDFGKHPVFFTSLLAFVVVALATG